MMEPPLNRYQEYFSDIQKEWDKAERSIKLAEAIVHEIVFPSINELRYAGRRIIDGIALIQKDGPQEIIQALFRDAILDCQRARFDAIDAVTSTLIIRTEALVDRIGTKPLLLPGSNFGEFFSKIERLQDRISEARQDRSRRDLLYSAIENVDLQELVQEYHKFVRFEGAIVARARRERWELAIARMFGVVGIIFGLISLLVLLIR